MQREIKSLGRAQAEITKPPTFGTNVGHWILVEQKAFLSFIEPHTSCDMVSASERINKRLENARKKEARDALHPEADADSDEDKPEWVGEPLNKDTFLKRVRSSVNADGSKKDEGTPPTSSRRATRGSGLSNIPLYGGFRKGGIEYKLGDIVLLENEQYSRKLDHPHVAQILSLWETEKGELEGNFRWFHQAEDIDKLRRYQKKGNFPDRLEQGEIVYSLDDDKNEVNTVVGKCTVLSDKDWRKKFGAAEAVLKTEEKGRFWFCRGMVRRMTGFSSMEWRGNEAMMNYIEPKETRPKGLKTESAVATKSYGKVSQRRQTRDPSADSSSGSEHGSGTESVCRPQFLQECLLLRSFHYDAIRTKRAKMRSS
jgi:hypothetical protein